MAEYFKRADDPSFATARKQLQSDAEDKLKGLTPGQGRQRTRQRGRPLGAVRQPGRAGRSTRRRGDGRRIRPACPDRYVGTGDADKAKAQTVERLKTVWGPSTVNGNALMRHPPERYYPQVDGSHDWMKRDVEAAINASRGGTENIAFNPKENLPPDVAPNQAPAYSYKVMSDPRTEVDVAARRPPSYTVVVKDLMPPAATRSRWAGTGSRCGSRSTRECAGAAREKFQTNRERAAT
jgi:hypothetical protein